MQGNPPGRGSAVRSGVLTGLSTAAVTGAAAVAGAILSRKFGHGPEAAGLLAAYGVYLALVLVANALRVVVLPRLARARAEGALGHEVGSWAAALAVPLAPIAAVALLWPSGIADALTGGGGAKAAAATTLLPWLVPAAVAQIGAGVSASGLAALDDYRTAAIGFALGAVSGLVVILTFVDRHGVVAFGWGLAVNGVVALLVPLVPLVAHGGVGLPRHGVFARLWELAEGVALPFALQGLFVIGNRFAIGLGATQGTTFSYAYLIASSLVAVTATSVALVSSVPLTRGGFTPALGVRHVVAASWLSLAIVAAAAGVFALAGERVVHVALGSHYAGATGTELGRLVVYLSPWMVASVAVSVTFPLLFVRGRARWLPVVAVGALLLHVPIVWGGRAAFGVAGIAGAMAVTTAGILTVLLLALAIFERTALGVLQAAAACGGLALATFGVASVVLGPVPGAAVGLAAYVAVLLAWKPAGLRAAWTYVRALQ